MLTKLARSVQSKGLLPTIQIVAKNVVHLTRQWVDGRFDDKYGVDTTGQIALEQLTINSSNKTEGVYFESTPLKTTQRILQWVVNHIADDLRYFNFIDFGSEKGRVLLLATQ